GYIQVCRGLMIAAICLGFFATACALVGMKCTKIGGSDLIKARIAFFAGFQFFISGMNWGLLCSLAGGDQHCVSWEGLCSSYRCLRASVKVCCTLAMDKWRITYIGGQGGAWIIKAAWYYSNLWKDCYTDTSSVENCRDYDVMWVINPTNTAERGFIQTVRGLLLFGMVVGFFAAIFCFVGMDCTYIGGSERTNDIILLTGALFHFIGGVAGAAAYCFFTIKLGRANFVRLSARGFLRYYSP
ncbi:claudin-10-like isoform X1, partial [Astyanax mexicanus]